MNISIVKSYSYPVVTGSISFPDYFDVISNPDSIYRPGIEGVRNDIRNKDKIKPYLPSVMPHGIFSYGNNESILSFSDHLFIDLDPKDHKEAIDIRDACMSLQFTRAAWLSPSGTGVHLIIYCPGLQQSNFEGTMNSLHKAMIAYNYIPDSSAKGISRKMVISYDPQIRINPDPVPFDIVRPIGSLGQVDRSLLLL